MNKDKEFKERLELDINNCINLVTGEKFCGKVMPWEALVLSRKE